MKKLVTFLTWVSMLWLISGCSMTSEQKLYTVVGADTGALAGTALGCGISAAIEGNDPTSYEIGCPTGFVLGALVGGIVGYMQAPPPSPPPPPPAPPPAAPPPPPPPAPQERIILRGVHFDFNKYNIRADAVPILDEAADILGKHPDVTVDVNGYCDIIGSYPYNQRLSERRADAVARYLEGKGIPSNRLVVHGYGKTHFVATNKSAEGRAQNRRVELVPEGQ